ncbi:MAG: aminomethyl-transferring glycine dehydrogenase subunit GcvPA [Pseudomonadales bacterium]|nr:aminomethyl-transferring glycine dehydrogenase subunit GcvPA [Pseudomonadales bacterium]
MPYIPHTDADIQAMLETIGVDSIDDLFDEIPADILSQPLSQVPEGISEMEASRLMADRAAADSNVACFIGAGAYEHHIPAAVWEIVGRGEFMTAYTPYQAEASQGTLQVIYEYQSMMAHLNAMDVSNASLYDGGSALAEAVLMAIRANRKSKSKKVLIPTSVNPLYRSATHGIVENQGISIEEVAFCSDMGTTPLSALEHYAGQDYAALVIQQPNFFGCLEDVHALTDWAHANKMLVIAVVNPTSLAILAPPGDWGEAGADISVGEGQPLGIPLSSGGPYFGFMCCKQGIVRQMPGRIIGRTVDLEGKEGFTLTLQAREQHIRRSKATSNICTNQGLAMTAATIYTSLLGADGLAAVANASATNTQTLVAALTEIDGVETVFAAPYFHEVVIRVPGNATDVLAKLAERRVQGGFDVSTAYAGMDDAILVCATETKNAADIQSYKVALADVLSA